MRSPVPRVPPTTNTCWAWPMIVATLRGCRTGSGRRKHVPRFDLREPACGHRDAQLALRDVRISCDVPLIALANRSDFPKIYWAVARKTATARTVWPERLGSLTEDVSMLRPDLHRRHLSLGGLNNFSE